MYQFMPVNEEPGIFMWEKICALVNFTCLICKMTAFQDLNNFEHPIKQIYCLIK